MYGLRSKENCTGVDGSVKSVVGMIVNEMHVS